MKKCPNCGEPLEDIAFKCNKCNQWVDNEVFKRIGEENVKLIKENDLIVHTPSLLTAYIIQFLFKEDVRKQIPEPPGEKILFRLLLFYSFCYFYAARLHVGAKQGFRDTLVEMLRGGLLGEIVGLFVPRVESETLANSLMEHGEAVYKSLDDIMAGINLESDAKLQLEAAKGFEAVIYENEEPTVSDGLELYKWFWGTVGETGKLFSKMFLVEEGDFDWRSVAGV